MQFCISSRNIVSSDRGVQVPLRHRIIRARRQQQTQLCRSPGPDCYQQDEGSEVRPCRPRGRRLPPVKNLQFVYHLHKEVSPVVRALAGFWTSVWVHRRLSLAGNPRKGAIADAPLALSLCERLIGSQLPFALVRLESVKPRGP